MERLNRGGDMKGKMTISKVTSNTENDYINIEIIYGNQTIRGKMSLINYAKMISGLARVPLDLVAWKTGKTECGD